MTDTSTPNRTDQALYLIGLVIFTLGQVQLNLLGRASQDQVPVDWAHWFLLIGVVLLIPYTARLPRRGFNLLVVPVMLAGIVAVIGMNVIDFVFWGLDDAMDSQFYEAISGEFWVWGIFMRYGPGEVFTTGLILVSLALWRVSWPGTLIAMIGFVIMIVGTQWYNVLGYSLAIIGYFLNFDRLGLGRSASGATTDSP